VPQAWFSEDRSLNGWLTLAAKSGDGPISGIAPGCTATLPSCSVARSSV